ncbi:excinuclease ABC subunit UvrC, partial [Patescibacteria group bacterium]|nr:excinuclease ABC subunit UvrC [Patescibacteria group bacterium]
MQKNSFKPDFKQIPHLPGVYLMYGGKNKVIYVGKAGDLKHRLASYWQKKSDQSPKNQVLLTKVNKVDFIITDNEVEALILENELIKRHYPQFNILLRDDKAYQYIRVGLNEKFPTITSVRKVNTSDLNKGAKYFGPFTSGTTVKNTFKLINNIFGVCSKVSELNRNNVKAPCLNWHLDRCSGPCAGQISSDAYKNIIHQVIKFLGGDLTVASDYLHTRMQMLVRTKKFESAAKARDELKSLELLTERQKVDKPGLLTDSDIIGQCTAENKLIVSRMIVRNGRLIDQQIFPMSFAGNLSKQEIASGIIKAIYDGIFENLPKEILVSCLPDDKEELTNWLSQKRGRGVNIVVPVRGIKKQLLTLAGKNALQHQTIFAPVEVDIKVALKELAEILKLKSYLKRIEAYDISHLGGTSVVGSMVVFTDGQPNKKEYRRFKIKFDTNDDYAALAEVIGRRLHPNRKADKRFASNLPDLILIDGGKGQLRTVLKNI